MEGIIEIIEFMFFIYRRGKWGLKRGRELRKGIVGGRVEIYIKMDFLFSIFFIIVYGFLVLFWIEIVINIIRY